MIFFVGLYLSLFPFDFERFIENLFVLSSDGLFDFADGKMRKKQITNRENPK